MKALTNLRTTVTMTANDLEELIKEVVEKETGKQVIAVEFKLTQRFPDNWGRTETYSVFDGVKIELA